MPIPAPVYGLAGVIITGLGAWLVAHRQRSGTIRTSEAKDLWDKFESLNHDLSAELEQMRIQMRELGDEHASLREAAAECEQRVMILQDRLRKIESDADAAKIIARALEDAERIRTEALHLREAAEIAKDMREDKGHGHGGGEST